METIYHLTDAYNLLHQHAPKIISEVKAQLDPFIGKQIFKADGSWRKAVNWNAPEVKGTHKGGHFHVYCWVRNEFNYIRLFIKICYNGGSYDDKTYFCTYREVSLDIYTADNDGKIGLTNYDLARFDVRYDADAMIKQNEVAKAKAVELEREIDAIPYQFREVLYTPSLR